MRHPESLAPLIDQGIIQEVVRPLMSGKEAQIYLVVSADELRVAKVYKTAENRTFRQRAAYTEGRAVRNTRTQRAMSRHSRYGRAQDEASWRSAEADIIYRLRAAGVRVPEPHHFLDGVLVMELITGADGEPAPRLADVPLGRVEASAIFTALLSEVVKMLCAGVVHGDLSEFNVLLGQNGPVLIDFPQAVDPAHNQNARKLLLRDVDNLTQFLRRVSPGQRRLPFGPELWNLYARSELTPETQLTGRYQAPVRQADTSEVMREIEVAARDAQRKREALDPRPGRRGRRGKKPAPLPEIIVVTKAKDAPGAVPTTGPTRHAPPATGPARQPQLTARPPRGAAAITEPARPTPPATGPAIGPASTVRSDPETKPAASGARRRRRRRRRAPGAG